MYIFLKAKRRLANLKTELEENRIYDFSNKHYQNDYFTLNEVMDIKNWAVYGIKEKKNSYKKMFTNKNELVAIPIYLNKIMPSKNSYADYLIFEKWFTAYIHINKKKQQLFTFKILPNKKGDYYNTYINKNLDTATFTGEKVCGLQDVYNLPEENWNRIFLKKMAETKEKNAIIKIAANILENNIEIEEKRTKKGIDAILRTKEKGNLTYRSEKKYNEVKIKDRCVDGILDIENVETDTLEIGNGNFITKIKVYDKIKKIIIENSVVDCESLFKNKNYIKELEYLYDDLENQYSSFVGTFPKIKDKCKIKNTYINTNEIKFGKGVFEIEKGTIKSKKISGSGDLTLVRDKIQVDEINFNKGKTLTIYEESQKHQETQQTVKIFDCIFEKDIKINCCELRLSEIGNCRIVCGEKVKNISLAEFGLSKYNGNQNLIIDCSKTKEEISIQIRSDELSRYVYGNIARDIQDTAKDLKEIKKGDIFDKYIEEISKYSYYYSTNAKPRMLTKIEDYINSYMRKKNLQIITGEKTVRISMKNVLDKEEVVK